MWQVGQEMLRLGASANMGYFVDTYVYIYYFVFENIM